MSVPPAGWRRPVAGRVVSGLALLCARRAGLPPALVRAAFAVLCLCGLGLVLGAGLFDRALLGSAPDPGLRALLCGLGLVFLCAYPLLSLALPEEGVPRRWDFGSSAGAVLLALLAGQAVGVLVAPFWGSAREAWAARGASGCLTWPRDHAARVGFGGKDLLLVLFFLSAGISLFRLRAGLARFFRAMHTGVTLVALTTLTVTAGVLVPQIDGFEDPAQRVDLAREHEDYLLFAAQGYQKLPRELQDGHEQYQAFRWAEGYFLYHLLHLYGLGMPTVPLAPHMEQGLERFGLRYGQEEAQNRRKEMSAALNGQEKITEIGVFLHDHEHALWRAFELSTLLELNRVYKSHWFATLLGLLGTSVFLSAVKGWRWRGAELSRALGCGLVAGGFAVLLKLSSALHLPWADLLLLAAVMAAAGAALGAGLPRQTLSLQKVGFLVVHAGLVLLLVGGGVSKLFTERGLLVLNRGEPPQDTYLAHFDGRNRKRLPFAVRLDHFARQDWRALEVHFLEEEFTSRVPRYTLWEGRSIELDHAPRASGETRPRLRLDVLELHDRAQVGLPFVAEAEPGAEGIAVAELLVGPRGVDEAAARRCYLPPMVRPFMTYRDEVLRDPGGAFRLAAAWGPDPGAPFPRRADEPRDPDVLEGVGDGMLGHLEVTVVGKGDGTPRELPIHLGQSLELDGGYRLRVVDACADFGPGRGDRQGSTHPLPLAAQPYGFAAVWVELSAPDGGPGERRLVVEGIDAVEHGAQADYFYPEVVLRLAWDAWTAPGPPRYRLCWGGAEEPWLLGEDGSRSPVLPGRPLELPGETDVVPRQLLQRAVFEKNLEFLPPSRPADGWDADFYARLPRGLELRVVEEPGTAAEQARVVRLATTDELQSDLWFSPDGRFALRFVENREMLPFEWRSVLSIFERDGTGRLREVPLGSERAREIRVNDYLYYRGYRLFQTDANVDLPDYSGIGVVFDPGIPLVLTGMYTIIAGTVLAFLVRPIVLGRRMTRKEATT